MYLSDDGDAILSAGREEFDMDEYWEELAEENIAELDQWESASKEEYVNSPEGKLRLVAEAATNAAKGVLLKGGWFPDQNGDWDFTLFEVERMLMEYIERYLPNK